jgi:hypothetical protein
LSLEEERFSNHAIRISAETLITLRKISLIGYFQGFDGPEHEQYEDGASQHDYIAFFKTTDPLVAGQMGLKKVPSFALIRNFPDSGVEIVHAPDYAVMIGNSTLSEELVLFIQSESLPLGFRPD